MGRGIYCAAKSRRTHGFSTDDLDSPSRKLGANFGSKTPNKPATFCHHSRARLRFTPPVCSPFLQSPSRGQPFRIKSVEPLRRTTPEVRRRLLEQAGYNLFSISSESILIE
jgi:hypothetical protein